MSDTPNIIEIMTELSRLVEKQSRYWRGAFKRSVVTGSMTAAQYELAMESLDRMAAEVLRETAMHITGAVEDY